MSKPSNHTDPVRELLAEIEQEDRILVDPTLRTARATLHIARAAAAELPGAVRRTLQALPPAERAALARAIRAEADTTPGAGGAP